MITAAITAAIVAVLGLFGIPPGAYVAGIAIGVKITLVAIALLVVWRVKRRRARASAENPGAGVDPPDRRD